MKPRRVLDCERYTGDETFIELWRRLGSATKVAAKLKIAVRAAHARRRNIEKRHGLVLTVDHPQSTSLAEAKALARISPRRQLSLVGQVVVFSDAHFWPGDNTVAYRALLEWAKHNNPVAVVANGDIFDGARVSRFPPEGWTQRPSMKDELEACAERMDAIRRATRKAKHHMFNWGNHDIRFARYLATNAPEMEGVLGSELSDHVKHWEMGWSIAVNGHTMIKHRQHGGIHAAYNNTLRAGWTMVTGHLHRLLVTPWPDYNGIRWGVDTGTLAPLEPEAGQFAYSEDNAKPWSQGFAVLTFLKDGTLIEPELCRVIKDKAYWRGECLV